MLRLLVLLIAAHSLCDYPWQGDFLSKGKHQYKSPYLAWMPWQWCLAAHASIHAGLVTAITGSGVLGICEFVGHFAIDYARSEDWINIHKDQTFHILCKFAWLAIIVVDPGLS